ncbi:MAG: hypothetical protein QNJ44_08170 [Rhodobacter sp.]|nr:hypothetical protein [Rhodobacter sp.]
MRHLGATTVSAVLLAGIAGAPALANDGQTLPKPVFQLGDTPSEPLAEGSAAAQGFLDFFNNTYQTGDNPQLPNLTKDDVVWFPPQRAGDTSLELVARVEEILAGKTRSNPPNCNPGDPGFPPQGYPLVCETGEFSTGQFCQACHDSALYVEGGGLPEMMYADAHEEWLANWSQYGDWSATIMRLATRDPIWQAQIETETNVHSFADPHVIQDVCFSCHGEMGERQLKTDIHDLLSQPDLKAAYMQALGVDAQQLDASVPQFCTDVFYATVPGILSEFERGKPYPFSDDCAPIGGISVADNPQLYAKYGALARDGVSCETCHRIGPEDGAGDWDGTSFDVFYGMTDLYDVAERQTDNPVPLEYEFTATFHYDMNNVMAPDPIDTLDTQPMQQDDNLSLATAINEAVKVEGGQGNVSYLQQSVICGACHVLIVPQIPASYQPGAPLPTTQYYERPKACTADTFSTENTRMMGDKLVGNPVLDPCVALGYEQATYLEWLTSAFATEQNADTTCQACHMPLVTDPDNPTDHRAIMAQSTQGLTPKTYRRHRLMGINLPVSEMFMQFPDVLGVFPYSDNVPDYAPLPDGQDVAAIQNYLLNGQMAIVEQATSQANGTGLPEGSATPEPQAAVEIADLTAVIDAGALVAELTLVNNAGHKFPSGAGFRRGFVRFEVLDDAGAVLWVSGQTNPYGAICNGPCVENPDGTFNLVQSEVNGGDPAMLQPHYEVITSQDQVQIYEVQTVDDTGALTSSTLALFHDAKDNRLLPRGFVGPEELGCHDDPNAGTAVFGIPQCSSAYATEPQLDPLTVGSAIALDPHYTQSALAGSDQLTYAIPLIDIDGTPASVRVSLEYQTIPPSYLAARFTEGHTENGFLPATERAVYLTSHLNLDLGLKSEHPDNTDVTFSQNWTSTIFQASAEIGQTLPPASGSVQVAPAIPERSDGRTGCDPVETPFYTSPLIPFDYSGEGPVFLSSTPDGSGATFVDDELFLSVFLPDGSPFMQELIPYASSCGSGVDRLPPEDVSVLFKGEPGTYLIQAQLIDIYPDKEGASALYLVPGQ